MSKKKNLIFICLLILGVLLITGCLLKPPVTVTFDSQGGSPVDSQIVNHGEKVTKPTAPTKEGYTFGGWYKEYECTNAWDFDTDTVTTKVTLYAKWTTTTYTVTFRPQGGNPVDSQIVNHGEKVIRPTAPRRAGYTFAGWYKEYGCTNAWDFDTDMVSSDITLYAKWTINSYTVTFDSQDGSAVGSQTVGHCEKVTKPANPTNIDTDYVFDGWYEESECTNAWDFDTDMVSSDVTLYAKWTIDRYVSKSGNNGNVGSADHPWLTIQYALDNAPDGGTIHVADGTYEENISFPTGKAIVLKSENGAALTTIDGDGAFIVVIINSCADGTTLDGFTITGGNGGIFILDGTPTIQDNTISGNNSYSSGGGIYISGGTPTIQNNTISENTAVHFAGGIFIANSSSIIQNNTISGNTAESHGGGFFISDSSTIQDNTISGNTAGGDGGGIFIFGSPTIQNNTISENNVNDDGGGIYISGGTPIIGDTDGAETNNFNTFINNRKDSTISAEQHIRNSSGDCRSSYPYNYYTPN